MRDDVEDRIESHASGSDQGQDLPDASPVEGFLDFVDGERVVGWAFDPSAPQRRILIELTAGGSDKRVLANVARLDLKDAGKGDGNHGFVAVLAAAAGAVEIRAYAAATGQELNGSPFRTGLAATVAHPSKRAALETFAAEMLTARLLLTGAGDP